MLRVLGALSPAFNPVQLYHCKSKRFAIRSWFVRMEITVKARKAGNVKDALQILVNKLCVTGATPEQLIDALKADHKAALNKDQDDLIELALRTLIGHLIAAPVGDDAQEEMFPDDVPRKILRLTMEVDGKRQPFLRKFKDTPLSVWDSRVMRLSPKARRSSHDDVSESYFAKMRNARVSPNTTPKDFFGKH